MTQDSAEHDIGVGCLSYLIPPLGVFVEVGIGSIHFWINILLTLCGWLPGFLHAIYIIRKK